MTGANAFGGAGPVHAQRAPGMVGAVATCHGHGTTKTQESLSKMALETFEGHRIQEIVRNVCTHYQVPMAFLAMEGSECLWLKARTGVDIKSVPLDSIARHWVARDLPIIIEDTEKEKERWGKDSLVHSSQHMRFFTGAPLMTSASVCAGSLVIMDAAPRPGFGLKDSDFLTRAAEQIMAVFRATASTQEWWKVTLPSLADLPNINGVIEEEESDDEAALEADDVE